VHQGAHISDEFFRPVTADSLTLMDDIRKHGGYMFTKSRLPIVTEIPTVNRRRAATARRNTRAALMPWSSGRAGYPLHEGEDDKKKLK
jgi:hypothetical protein